MLATDLKKEVSEKTVLNKSNLFKEIWGMLLNSKVQCSLHKTFLQVNTQQILITGFHKKN